MTKREFEALQNQIHLLKHLRDVYEVSLPYEQLLRCNYRKLLTPQSVVLDIGAHSGEHLESFLEIAGPEGLVIAFEPIPRYARDLEKRFAPKRDRFRIHKVALSDHVGESDFVFAEGTPGESGLRQRIFSFPAAAKPKKITVPVGRLDDFTKDLEHIDYVKIDIEGGELDCIHGGMETLRRFQPIVSVEYGFASYSPYGHQVDDLWKLARKLEYTCFDIFGNSIETLEQWCALCDQVYWDYYIVPDGKVELFKGLIRGTV